MSNPRLMCGILATVLVQSSSSTTSVIVAMTAAGFVLPEQAIFMVMGANIGTSVTSTIVALFSAFNKKQFTRAFAAGTVHDFINLLDVLVPNSQSALGDGWEAMAANLIAGYGAIPLVGTPEQIIDGMLAFSEAGLDGITLSWVNYEEGLTQFNETLLPLMTQAGLREG